MSRERLNIRYLYSLRLVKPCPNVALQTLLTGGIAPSQNKGKGKEIAKDQGKERPAEGSEDEDEATSSSGMRNTDILV